MKGDNHYHLQENTKIPSKLFEILPDERHVITQINAFLHSEMATGQAVSIGIALKSGLLQPSLQNWPKRWTMGACKTVIVQIFQDLG